MRRKVGAQSLLVAAVVLLAACQSSEQSNESITPAVQQSVLHVYNWTDYVAPDTIPEFERRTGIKVVYETYTENEALDEKLRAGNSGFDLVFPSLRPFAQQHLQAKLYAPLNRRRLPNLRNIDPEFMVSLSEVDVNNSRLVPYLWGTTGIGVNLKAVQERLGEDTALDTWRLIFDPAVAAKLAGCGISVLDTDLESLSAALIYRSRDPNSAEGDEQALLEATFSAVRKYITSFDSADYIDKLASGEICVAMGYSGDIAQAAARAEELGNGIEVKYVIPREGALRWMDVMAIPKDAPHKTNAHAFINYLLEPEVIAKITNTVAYANPNLPANPLVSPEIASDAGIYPPDSVRSRLFDPKQLPEDAQAMRSELWLRIRAPIDE
ncbi:MAG: polyamine ABC transporter substrate-binding protein [Lysobacteraceae bacterium]